MFSVRLVMFPQVFLNYLQGMSYLMCVLSLNLYKLGRDSLYLHFFVYIVDLVTLLRLLTLLCSMLRSEAVNMTGIGIGRAVKERKKVSLV